MSDLQGIQCPKCGACEAFRVDAECAALLTAGGAELQGDMDWTDESWANYMSCQHEAQWGEFQAPVQDGVEFDIQVELHDPVTLTVDGKRWKDAAKLKLDPRKILGGLLFDYLHDLDGQDCESFVKSWVVLEGSKP